jgi:hypothetical protein
LAAVAAGGYEIGEGFLGLEGRVPQESLGGGATREGFLEKLRKTEQPFLCMLIK